MWNSFKDIMLEGIDKFIPKTCCNKNRKAKHVFPFNKSLQTLIRKKHRSWNRWMETRDGKKHREYVTARNDVKREIRKMKQLEQDSIAAQCKHNPKIFWKFVKSKTKTNTKINELKWVDPSGNTTTATSDIDKANALEDFFSSVFTVESDDEFEELEKRNISQPMHEMEITLEAVKAKLAKLKINKSPGGDQLHPRVLSETREQIAEPLLMIFRNSLLTGQVPVDWKLAEVVALHKKGARSDRGNYRPVSLTSVCCKVLESLIRDHVMSHLLNNDLLSKSQFGFVKGRSTMLQLLCMLDQWTEFFGEGWSSRCHLY